MSSSRLAIILLALGLTSTLNNIALAGPSSALDPYAYIQPQSKIKTHQPKKRFKPSLPGTRGKDSPSVFAPAVAREPKLPKIKPEKIADIAEPKRPKVKAEKIAKTDEPKPPKVKPEKIAKTDEPKPSKVKPEKIAEITEHKLPKVKAEKIAKTDKPKSSKVKPEKIAEITEPKSSEGMPEKIAEISEPKSSEGKPEKIAKSSRFRRPKIKLEKTVTTTEQQEQVAQVTEPQIQADQVTAEQKEQNVKISEPKSAKVKRIKIAKEPKLPKVKPAKVKTTEPPAEQTEATQTEPQIAEASLPETQVDGSKAEKKKTKKMGTTIASSARSSAGFMSKHARKISSSLEEKFKHAGNKLSEMPRILHRTEQTADSPATAKEEPSGEKITEPSGTVAESNAAEIQPPGTEEKAVKTADSEAKPGRFTKLIGRSRSHLNPFHKNSDKSVKTAQSNSDSSGVLQ